MNLYRRVSIRMWGDEKFKLLSRPKPNAQTLFVYLMTGPHTGMIPGLSVAGEAALSEAIGWSLGAFRRVFAELAAHGMAQADWVNRVIYLPRAKHHNRPTNTNIVTGWAQAFTDLPECPLVTAAWSDFRAFGLDDAFTDAFRQAFTKAFGHDFRNSSGSGSGSGRASEEPPPTSPAVDKSHPRSEVAYATGSERPPQPSADEQLRALADANGTTPEHMREAAQDLAKRTGALMHPKRRRA